MKFVSSIVVAVLSSCVFAQRSEPGVLTRQAFTAFAPKTIALDALNNEELMNSEVQAEDGGFVFGKARDVSINVPQECAWRVEGNYKVCRLEISSPNAVSININFDQFKLAESSELYVIGREVITFLSITGYSWRLHSPIQ